jgi:hypothetical protein
MKVVHQVPFGARGCAVTGRTADADGFIQQNSPTEGHALHISAEAVRIMGHEFGMVPKDEAIQLRFELHELQRELREAQQTIRDQELLQRELAEAKETIRESEDILATFEALASQGYDSKKVKRLLKTIEQFEDNFGEIKHTLAEMDDALDRTAALTKREKVLA